MRVFQAAICEDQLEELRYIEGRLQEAFRQQNLPVEFRGYTSGTLLLSAAELIQQRFDLFFLDIEMPGLNGIELCRKLRARYPESLVIFISNREEMVFQTFEVRPFRFLRKHHFSEELPELVTALVRELRRREDADLCVQALHSDAMYVWKISQIVSVEALGKLCRVRTPQGEDTLQYRFMDFERQLAPYGFLKPHRSFLVNYRYISRIEKSEILLDGGGSIPISRGKMAELRTAFVKLMNGGGYAL